MTATVADLYPGADGDLVIRVHNQDPYPVVVTDVALDGTAASLTSDGSANCQGLGTGVTITYQHGLSGVAYELDAAGGANGDEDHHPRRRAAHEQRLAHGLPGRALHDPATVTTTSDA